MPLHVCRQLVTAKVFEYFDAGHVATGAVHGNEAPQAALEDFVPPARDA